MGLKQYNEELLFEDLNFPLKYRRGSVIDSSENFIMEIDEDLAKKIIGRYKIIEQAGDRYEADYDGLITDTKNDLEIGKIDVWGRLSHKDEPTNRTENVIRYILDRLNAL